MQQRWSLMEDKLSSSSSPETVALKTFGQPVKDLSILEWTNGTINLFSLKGIKHQKIQLNAAGKGIVNL